MDRIYVYVNGNEEERITKDDDTADNLKPGDAIELRFVVKNLYDDNYDDNSAIMNEECGEVFRRISDYAGLKYSLIGGFSTRMKDSVLYNLMKNVIKMDGYAKKIPEFIFGLSNEQIKHFMRGYFSANGDVKKYEVSCASQSYELLRGIQTMLLRLGIISKINDFERKDKCMNMSISESKNVEEFKKIGFLQKRKNAKFYSGRFGFYFGAKA